MDKSFRRLGLALLLLVLAAVAALTDRPAAACQSGYYGTWNGDCTGAARDCAVIFVCGGGARPV